VLHATADQDEITENNKKCAYPADKLAYLLRHNSEMLAGQRPEKIGQWDSALQDVFQKTIRTKETAKKCLNTTALNTSRYQWDLVAEEGASQCCCNVLW